MKEGHKYLDTHGDDDSDNLEYQSGEQNANNRTTVRSASRENQDERIKQCDNEHQEDDKEIDPSRIDTYHSMEFMPGSQSLNNSSSNPTPVNL